jgi:hypothetical protein
MKPLRQYGIYKIPGIERSLFLVSCGLNIYFLYDIEFGAQLPPRFHIAANGHINNWFEDFPVWTVDDLIDTGETYKE